MVAALASEAVKDSFRRQVVWCDRLGSPFTARLLEQALADLDAGGPTAALLGAWRGDASADALALRYAGALNGLVLAGRDAELARHYPGAGNPTGSPVEAHRAALAAITREPEYFARVLALPPQTNEVGRSGILLGGFLEISHLTRLPLRLIEIGASAGLNLVFDRFHYRLGEAQWGDASSPVRLAPEWTGGLPPLDAPLKVSSRQGCDIAPIDIGREAEVARLKSYVWPDQFDRILRLEGAIRLARAEGVHVEKADALLYLRHHLSRLPEGRASVVFHSIFWQYLPADTQAGIEASLEEAGSRAAPQSPLAWLRFEPDSPPPPAAALPPALKLTIWPGGQTHTLARAHFHGASVEWC